MQERLDFRGDSQQSISSQLSRMTLLGRVIAYCDRKKGARRSLRVPPLRYEPHRSVAKSTHPAGECCAFVCALVDARLVNSIMDLPQCGHAYISSRKRCDVSLFAFCIPRLMFESIALCTTPQCGHVFTPAGEWSNLYLFCQPI